MTPTEAVAACKSLKAQLESGKSELRACRRAARAIRKGMVKEFTRTGIGAAIWGRKAAKGEAKSRDRSLQAVIPGPRVVADGKGFLITSKLRGIAALVEKGGATKPHRITGEQGARLTRSQRKAGAERAILGTLGFVGKSGHVITPKAVHHPGSRFAKNDFASRAWHAAVPVLQAEIEKGYEELAEKFPSRY